MESRKGEHVGSIAHPFLVLLSVSECRRLHTHPATSVTASMAPAPVAVTVAAAFHPVIVARLHLVIILAPVPPAIVILSAHRQPDYGENRRRDPPLNNNHKIRRRHGR